MLISKSELSKLEEARLNFKFGILPDRKDSKPSQLHIIKELTELFSFTILPTDNHSKTLLTGSLKLINTATKTSSNFSSATNPTWNPTDRSKPNKERL